MSVVRTVLGAIEIQFGCAAERAAAAGYQCLEEGLGDLAFLSCE